jgi:hypothetical protein
MNSNFKVGDIVILRNDPSFTIDPGIKRIEGEEVEIIGPLRMRHLGDGPFFGYMVWHPSCQEFYCAPHELRRRPPSTTGEQKIRSMFDAPLADRRAPATAWQAQYDTAQALMRMGVRVRPGKWPVETV